MKFLTIFSLVLAFGSTTFAKEVETRGFVVEAIRSGEKFYVGLTLDNRLDVAVPISKFSVSQFNSAADCLKSNPSNVLRVSLDEQPASINFKFNSAKVLKVNCDSTPGMRLRLIKTFIDQGYYAELRP